MSINKIIVNTTTGQQAADSINEVIDLAEAAATLGSNEFTGDQLVNGNDKQVFAEPSEGRINIAEVTGVASAIANFNQTAFGFRKDELPGLAGSGNAWFSEVYTDETRVQGSEIFVGGQKSRIVMRSNDGIGVAGVDLTAIDSGANAGKTQALIGADRMFIGGPVFTRDFIVVGHANLPLFRVDAQSINLFPTGSFFVRSEVNSELRGDSQTILRAGLDTPGVYKSNLLVQDQNIELIANSGNSLVRVQDGVRLATNIDSETGDAGAFINLQSNGEVIDIFTGNVITINAGNKTEVLGNIEFNNLVVLVDYPNLNFADDAAAEAGNVPLGGVYHNNGALRVRVA